MAVSKERRNVLKQVKAKQEAKKLKSTPDMAFYNSPEYLDKLNRYTVKGLTALEMNIMRSALLHFFRSNPDNALWEHMEKFAVIGKKFDAAEVAKLEIKEPTE